MLGPEVTGVRLESGWIKAGQAGAGGGQGHKVRGTSVSHTLTWCEIVTAVAL